MIVITRKSNGAEVWGERIADVGKVLVGTVNLDVTIAGADINGVDIACDTSGVLDSSLGGDTDLNVGEELKLEITSVLSSPTYLLIQINGTYDD